MEWVDWFNHRRLLEPIGYLPPAELEEIFYRGEVSAEEAGLKQLSLHLKPGRFSSEQIELLWNRPAVSPP